MIGELSPFSDKNEDLRTASVEFIFSDHSEDNLGKVADAVLASDGNIIAIEKIREGSFGMGTAEEKKDLAERMTRFIAADSTATQTANEHFQTDEPFFTKLLDNLKGSGKRIVLIDMGTDDKGYAYHKNAQSSRNANSESIAAGIENKDLFLDYVITYAQSYEYREHVMHNQLALLAQSNPGSKITVILGAMHTQVSHGLAPTIKCTRIFVPTDKEAATYAPSEKMRFERPWSDIRTIRFNLHKLGLSTLNEVENQSLPGSK